MLKLSELTPKFPVKTAYGIFTAALLAFTSLNFPEAEDRNHAYRDFLNRPAICGGHTDGVKMTDVVSDAKCEEYRRNDLFIAIDAALTETPTLVENKNAFRASSEFIMTTSIEIYRNSPMAKYFSDKDWDRGCSAFRNYMVVTMYSNRQPNLHCVILKTGKWLCTIPELIKLREEQSQICSGKILGA